MRKDPYAKEVKETMSKPVAVPLDQFVGLTLIASKDKTTLVQKLTRKAAATIESYADVGHLEAREEASVAAAAAPTAGRNSNSVAQTLYVPILFPNI